MTIASRARFEIVETRIDRPARAERRGQGPRERRDDERRVEAAEEAEDAHDRQAASTSTTTWSSLAASLPPTISRLESWLASR